MGYVFSSQVTEGEINVKYGFERFRTASTDQIITAYIFTEENIFYKFLT